MAKGKTKTNQAKASSPKGSESFAAFFAGESTANCAPESTSLVRRNRSSTIERTDKYKNISDTTIPYETNNNNIDVREAVILCQKAYFNFALFRNTIDVMTELSNSPIFLKGGNKKSRDFISAWLDKIDLWALKEKFFREFYRSGNVFYYRFDGKFQEEDIKRMTQTYGAVAGSTIPIRYILLNPADIKAGNNVTFQDLQYYKVLNNNELNRIRNPKTVEDQEVLKQMLPEDKRLIKTGTAPLLLLDPSKLYAIFYKKQDYEPFAVPMGFPVLEDINWKLELKKMDMAIARTTDWAVLLITMGAGPNEGGINYKNITAMQELLKNESVKRVLVADYTTKGEWLIPDVSKILGPEKYQIVNEDIRLGLNIILVGDEKFANSMLKTQLFLERLKEARNAFIFQFLLPEIKRISQDMGFKVYPTPYFEEVDLKDELQYAKVYSRLMEIGALTVEEGLSAIETGQLPTQESSIESQAEFRALKDKGYYQPLVGAAQPPDGAGAPAPAGRPEGTKAPQSTKKISPVGAKFNFEMLKTNMIEAQSLSLEVEKALKKKFKLKELSKEQSEASVILTKNIMANETVWKDKVAQYVADPKNINEAVAKEIDEIAADHGVSDYLAVLLYKSKIVE